MSVEELMDDYERLLQKAANLDLAPKANEKN